ncbi:enoyl-CoA hydratase/isomerase family protein [Azospirillum canadense]|uniref:enoyl-CoA hydratase/isomerase family protein n=1 Tax=Azospirillum canadense TaxID=403962 RepID=UPI0022261246|nr:enoyl-CoA hydratase/isomerase family protein [Azospirillum canadense]MCW2240589.1 enoyl-CoA hydratase/carnithine racemase [Azospirillum canadense]
MDEHVLFERLPRNEVEWALITLNRPDKGNALTMPMLERIDEILRHVAADRNIRAVVLRAKGRFFCTGGDIEAWGRLNPHDMGRDWILRGIDVFERLAAMPQPVIAGLSGHTLGGGLELAMAADLRVAVKNAKLGSPEVTLGMIPGWQGTSKLAELIGPSRARHMLLLGSPITADVAYEWGLVTAVVENEESLDQQVTDWIDRLTSNGPSALALVKGLLGTMHQDLRHHHASAVAQAAGTDDCKEGVNAFIEKRKPVFRNR